ncbi:MAG: L-asparaginase / beta-aspartyl-peptidase [Acidobacteriota bacterium]|jgi:ketosteroid isomerase-like protein|nr:L-asparaginase / beta-aspartyl-peptidase [Acidobacteriota bacterium]
MLKRLFFIIALIGELGLMSFAQNANTSNATRQRTSSAAPKTPARNVEEAGTPQATPTPTPRTTTGRRAAGSKTEPSAKDIIAIVNALKAGIEATNVDAVTGVYWNSPQLVLFNNNGSVTKGWEQMRKNRESSYPKLKDVKLEMRDLRVQMLGRDGAVANFLWTQSQTYDGTPETVTGRTTLVFRRIGNSWKAVHLHSSPDSPDQSRVLPSERTTPTPTPKATP